MIIRTALVLCAAGSQAWIPNLPLSLVGRPNQLFSASPSTDTATTASIPGKNTVSATEEDDDEEYEYIEYENLTEEEFVGSEWLVGTNWDRNSGNIEETWARLIVDASGKNVVVWGDNSEGIWTLDVASQFISLSKENKFTGKDIWASTVDDYYYLQGTVRGWRFWSPAAVLGQWQARRLGVDKDEAGTPPWFEEEEEENQSAVEEDKEVEKES